MSFTSNTGFSTINANERQAKSISELKVTTNTRNTHRINDRLSNACRGLQLSQKDLVAKLSAEDISDIETGRMTSEELRIWAVNIDMKSKKH